MRVKMLLLIAAALSGPGAVGAQVSLPGGGGGNTALLSGGNAFTIEIAESRLGLSYRTGSVNKKDCDTLPAAEQPQCMIDNAGLESGTRKYAEGSIAFAAEKGKRSLLSDGEITPGVEAALALGRTTEFKGGGHRTVYLALSAGTRSLDVATHLAGTVNTYVLDTNTERTSSVGIGLNLLPEEHWGFGVSIHARRAWSSPGEAKPKHVCTTRLTGADTVGNAITISDCRDRYLGPLGTVEFLQPRIEGLYNFNRKSGAESIGVIASISAKAREEGSPVFSAAFGPVLHPAGAPHLVRAAALIMFEDFTDAQEESLNLKDMLSIRLFLAIPLTGF